MERRNPKAHKGIFSQGERESDAIERRSLEGVWLAEPERASVSRGGMSISDDLFKGVGKRFRAIRQDSSELIPRLWSNRLRQIKRQYKSSQCMLAKCVGAVAHVNVKIVVGFKGEFC